MSVVYGIIKHHGGDIAIESEEGKGSTFRIRLPKAHLLHYHAEPPDMTAETAPLKGRILLIEDEEYNRELFLNALVLDGHQVVAAADGPTGLEQFEQESFDLVLTDLSMPGMNGWQVAAAVKQKDPQVRVILMSGGALFEDEGSAQEAGVDFLLPKPVPLDALYETVRKALQTGAESEKGASDLTRENTM